ncbi:MAG: sigma-70 family RNA polymerase sigma factor [Terriglobia bacterium]
MIPSVRGSPVAMLKTEVDEKQLVKDAKSGNYEAFEGLVHRYERKIYNVAYRLSGNREDAEDILQETFLKAFENLPRFREEASFYTWVMKIAVNATLIRFRKSTHPPMIAMDDLGDGPQEFHPRLVVRWHENPEQKYSRLEGERILRRAILWLPPIYRTVFWLRDVEEFSNAEVARMLGLSVFAVKSRLMRARLELRERLTAYYGKKGKRNKLQDTAHAHVQVH